MGVLAAADLLLLLVLLLVGGADPQAKNTLNTLAALVVAATFALCVWTLIARGLG